MAIFDFDGTIADTSLGIIDSHKFALSAMGREIPNDDDLRKVIGGQLLKTYVETFKFEESKAREAVIIYRERYSNVGMHLANLYPGFEELLSSLKNCNYKIGVATLKAERFAKTMLIDMGISQYFDVVCGINENDNIAKAGLSAKCCELCKVEKSKSILIGDSINDLIGARQAGVSFLGVTYGFGFNPEGKYDFDTADSTYIISRKLCL